MALGATFKDEGSLNVVERFKKLEHKGNLEDFIDDFEKLRTLLFQQEHYLPDSFILDAFIGGLKPKVRPFVRFLSQLAFLKQLNMQDCKKKQLI